MQYHLDGYRPGDPRFAPTTKKLENRSEQLPKSADVLIVGCGPAGLTLAAYLASFTDISTCIVDVKPGPLQRGQADGIACRSMEMFSAFGFVQQVLTESYWVNETTFWQPDKVSANKIARQGRVQDVEDGLSEFPHVIMNQARVHDYFLDFMRKSSTQLTPYYARKFVSLEVLSDNNDVSIDYPVRCSFEQCNTKDKSTNTETVNARYVVGCDGARSAVRQSIGLSLKGDSANHAWGVMDVLAITDFPDIRMKSLIRSAEHGSIVLIPREGGYLTRFYVELGKLDSDERVKERDITIEQLIATANNILQPYTLDVKEVAWWSVYEIGQRLCDQFDNRTEQNQSPNVFIAGDACHTHSPKAGQGMNVSMRDAFNLGWKLVSVLQARSKPDLLRTYTDERHAVAKTLIDFDREWSEIIASAGDVPSYDTDKHSSQFQDYFIRSGRYTAGTAIQYTSSIICGHTAHQHLAKGFEIGMRFHSANVVRLADAKPIQLGHCVTADARWRLFAFCDQSLPDDQDSAGYRFFEYLADDPRSPIRQYTSKDADIDSVFDVRAVYQQHFRKVELSGVPSLLLPRKGRYGLVDYEKIYCTNHDADIDIFEQRQIDRQKGCLVLIRPDQHVANVLPLNAYKELNAFFESFMISPSY